MKILNKTYCFPFVNQLHARLSSFITSATTKIGSIKLCLSIRGSKANLVLRTILISKNIKWNLSNSMGLKTLDTCTLLTEIMLPATIMLKRWLSTIARTSAMVIATISRNILSKAHLTKVKRCRQPQSVASVMRARWNISRKHHRSGLTLFTLPMLTIMTEPLMTTPSL